MGYGTNRRERSGLDLTWFERALCASHPEVNMHPSEISGVKVAKAFCSGCPVRMACLDYALEANEDHGVWGGHSERERRRIRRERLRRAA